MKRSFDFEYDRLFERQTEWLIFFEFTYKMTIEERHLSNISYEGITHIFRFDYSHNQYRS